MVEENVRCDSHGIAWEILLPLESPVMLKTAGKWGNVGGGRDWASTWENYIGGEGGLDIRK